MIRKERPRYTELPPVTPMEAVSEAMVYAYAQNFKDTSRSKMILFRIADESRHNPLNDLKRLTSALTREYCEFNSGFTLYYLHQHFPDLFTHFCLLESHIDKGKNDRPFRNVTWYRHVCFLVKDIHGHYYAGSPANYDTEDYSLRKTDQNRLNQFFSSIDLGSLISQVESYEQGVWPSLQFIEKTLNRQPEIRLTTKMDRYLNQERLEVKYIRRREDGECEARKENLFLPYLQTEDFLDPTQK